MTNHTTFKTIFQIPPIDECDTVCSICGNLEQRSSMAAGPYNADGDLTFICNEHLRNSHQLINSLADYMTEERLQLIHHKEQCKEIKEGVPDAWFLY